ncbi:Eukaryotic translation initiation factor 3 subunit D-2 [Dissostichus eleginoides]|uniref:Eukaryotic translation initiation factor 3 subunit D-2 n=1 Tax=Dissostichus eleginoides TaxID=100907 RepID=A0AAD9BPQ8_DISEL|nr:Eukaryotic translation initiation factor 3 subunit D-2 [Dissostichus eleginoides]
MAPKHALLSSSGSGGSGVGGVNTKRDSRASSAVAWVLDTGMVAVCSPRTRALDGKLARWLVTAVLVLMLQSSMAADGF